MIQKNKVNLYVPHIFGRLMQRFDIMLPNNVQVWSYDAQIHLPISNSLGMIFIWSDGF